MKVLSKGFVSVECFRCGKEVWFDPKEDAPGPRVPCVDCHKEFIEEERRLK